MAQPDWNSRYAAGDMPWDSGRPDPNLTEVVSAGAVAPGRALEVGCGTGTNALWLAEKGFDVLGVDLSPLAVEKARAKVSALPEVRCRFEVVDFLSAVPEEGPFDFVFDRGCFHIFDDAEERARFAAQVAAVLAPGGVWLSLIGSTEGAPRDVGPPRRSARDVVAAVEPVLEVVRLQTAAFDLLEGVAPKAWTCLARRREIPAQPSSRRP